MGKRWFSKKTIDETYKKNNEKSNDKDNAISKNAGESNKKLDSQNKDVGNSDNTEDKSSDKINEILKQIKEMKDSSK